MDKKERNKQIVEMYLSGKTQAEIGREFGLTRQMISLILKALDIPRMKRAKELWCNMCGCKLVNFENSRSGNNRCFACIEKRRQMWAPVLNLDACLKCKSTTRKHRSEGLCDYCFPRERWKDPEFKRKQIIRMSKDHKKNRARNLKKMKAYYYKNKFSMQLYAILVHLVKEDNRWE